MNIVLLTEHKLSDHGIESSKVNAEMMLTDILDCQRVDLYTEERTLSGEELARLENMISRRIGGEPLQYILGKTQFYGNDFLVEPGVLIPRPETELLVETVLNLMKRYEILDTRYEPSVLDLCAGSGNIAISLTKALTHCKIMGSDISKKAIEVAGKNAVRNMVEDRVSFVEADLFDLPADNKFDVIVSNPPYLTADMMKQLPKEVMAEPLTALYGDTDGLYFYSRIAQEAPSYLKSEGFVACEISPEISGPVKALFSDSPDFTDVQICKDYNDLDRVITAKKRLS
ncbi:peptide chain release factor N(5)-glutamine methyltransferase [Candidatus Omnitrophota bacterium]